MPGVVAGSRMWLLWGNFALCFGAGGRMIFEGMRGHRRGEGPCSPVGESVRVFVGAVATSFALAGCMRLPIGGPRVESLHGRIVTDAFVDDSTQIFVDERGRLASRAVDAVGEQRRSGMVAEREVDRVRQ